MRSRILATLLATTWASVAIAADPAPLSEPSHSSQPKPIVYLTGAVLADLKQSNPGHYDRAQRILAQAKEVCQPGAQERQDVKFDDSLECSGLMLKTTYPPKRQISFRLGDTDYIALVTITAYTPKTVPIR